jgi:hypothetical protein
VNINNTYDAGSIIPILGTGAGQAITSGLRIGGLHIGAYYANNNPVIWSESGLIIQASNGTVDIPRNNLKVGENLTVVGTTALSNVTAKGILTSTLSASRNIGIVADVPFASLSGADLRTKAQLVISQATASGYLYIANAYTGGSGSGSAIQSSDYYSSEDHGTTLFLNPLGGNVNLGDKNNIIFANGLWHKSSDNQNRLNFTANSTTYFGSGDGTFKFQNSINTVNTFTIEDNGNVTATGNVTAYSDARVKTNISNIDSPLEKIMKMRGVYYNRIDDIESKRQVGVIAQEVEEVLPEVVLTDTSEDKNKSVAYGNIVALLIEGMKAQQSTIEALKNTLVNIRKSPI